MELVSSRDSALGRADSEALAQVTVAGSALRQSDTHLLQKLTSAGTQLQNYRTEVSDIEVLGIDGDQARVQLMLAQHAHQRIAPTGQKDQVPAQEPHCVELALHLLDKQWRAAQAAPC